MQSLPGQLLGLLDLGSMMGGKTQIGIDFGTFSSQVPFAEGVQSFLEMILRLIPLAATLIDCPQFMFNGTQRNWFAESSSRFVAFDGRVVLSQVDVQVANGFM